MFLIKYKDDYIKEVSKTDVTLGSRKEAGLFSIDEVVDALCVLTYDRDNPSQPKDLDGSITVFSPRHRTSHKATTIPVRGKGLLLFFLRRGINQKTVGIEMGMTEKNAHNAHYYLTKDVVGLPRAYFDALRKKYPGVYHYVVKPEKGSKESEVK